MNAREREARDAGGGATAKAGARRPGGAGGDAGPAAGGAVSGESIPPVLRAELRQARRRVLGTFFAPEGIAVFGASGVAGTLGRAVMDNLRGYAGPVVPVAAGEGGALADGVRGSRPAVDLAVIATPAEEVPEAIRQCGIAGVQAAIVLSPGFRECGAGGAELERRVLAAARPGGVRILGPNCLGVMAPHQGLNATFARTIAQPGGVAFVSQSGAFCTAVLDWSLRDHVGLSALVSVGSMIDVGWGELITSLGDDPHTRSILIYMESIGDARAFLSAAREVAFSKPVIVVKAGRTEGGARAAASHTGALTGSDAVMDAAFRRAGVLRVDTIEDLFDMAEVLAKQPRPHGRRLGIVTNAGGPAALAADALVRAGGELAPLQPETLAALEPVLPAAWSRGNPVDLMADADAERYAQAVTMLLRDGTTDGVLVVLTPQAMSDPAGTAERVRQVVAGAAKPVLASWMGGEGVAAGERILNRAGIPTFAYADRAAQAFDYMWRYSANLDALYETPRLADEAERHARRAQGGARIAAARARRHLRLPEAEAKEVLRAHGIPVARAVVANREQAAVVLARRTGFPVAMKVHSTVIAHKAAVGGVSLGLRTVSEVREAWRGIRSNVTRQAGEAAFLGVTVQPMVTTEGVELIVGSSVDPQVGPVIIFGTGGRLAEAWGDTAVGLPPLTTTLARRLMEQTRVHAVLRAAGCDLAGLEQLLVRFSQLVAEQRAIREIDLNPVLSTRDGVIVLDARMELQPPDRADHELPRPAIRPYPQHYTVSRRLADGTPLVLRSIRAEDEPLMVRFHHALSEESVYHRYFTALSLVQRTSHARLARLCFIDHDREIALVAVREDRARRPLEIAGVGRLCKAHGRNEAEFAVIVADAWQGRGLGTLLLRRLVEVARVEGLQRITGTILSENHVMRDVCERVGFTTRLPPGADEIEAVLEL